MNNSDLSDKQSKTDNSLATTSKTIVGAINEHETDISNISETFFQNTLDSYQWIRAHYNAKTKLVVVDVCRFVAAANGTTIGTLSAHKPSNTQTAYCMLRNSDGTTQFGNFTIDSTGAIKINALTTNTSIAGCAHFEFPASS